LFYPEYIIGCSNKTTTGGIKGKIDLLVQHSDGTVDIIDYKLSTRSFDSWDPAKRYHVEYQMAIYRQILAAHGIDGSKVNLYAFPIHLPGKNI
jgi:ATP-dependent exoDNAse (exonuclease V) beta subunit